MRLYVTVLAATSLVSCATLNDSMSLGAGLGAVAGGLSTYAGQVTAGHPASADSVALGTGIGIAAGLLTSYFTHKSVDEHRQLFMSDQTEMHFGDLPPSPFVFPKKQSKKGDR